MIENGNNVSSNPSPRIYRLPQVMVMYGISKASVYRLIAQGQFPAPVKLGPRAVGWRQADLEDWEKRLGEQ